MLKSVAIIRPLSLLLACSLSGSVFATDITFTMSGTSPYCGGTSATVSYNASDFTFTSGNAFNVELSDASGNFSSLIIGTLSTIETTGDIAVNFPAWASGTGYKIRIVSTSPAVVGSDNGFVFSIIAATTPTITITADPAATIGAGSTVYFSSTITEGGSSPIYEWKKNGDVVSTSNAFVIPAAAVGDQVVAKLISSIPCALPATSNIINVSADNNLTRTNHAWESRASQSDGPNPIIRSNASGFSIGTKAYIGCGSTADNTYRKDLWEYDPATNVWTQKADLPGAGRYNAVAFTVGTKGFVGTGIAATGVLKDLWQYDALNNTWLQRQNLPGPARQQAFGFAIGNRGYIGGGYATAQGDFKDFYEFDPSANTWTPKADFAGGKRMGSAAFAIEGKGFVAGGFSSSSNTWFKDLWDFDQQANLWTSRADMPGNPRTRATGFALGGSGYVGFGYSGSGYEGQFFQYTLSTNSWSWKPYYPGPWTQTLAVGMAVGNRAYIYKDGKWIEYNLFTATSFASRLCSTETVPISFDASGFVFGVDNKFTAQMSSQPDFSVAATLGTLTTNASSGTINTVIPTSESGTYYFRVVSKSPVLSTMTETLTITGVSSGHTISTPGGGTVCKGVPVTFNSNLTGSGFQWYKNNSPVGTDATQYLVSSLTNGDVIKCVRTYTSGCSKPVGVASNPIAMNVREPEKPTISVLTPNTLESSSAIAYQWYQNGITITGANLKTYVMLMSGAYSVRTTDNGGCFAFSDEVTDVFIGLEDDVLNNGISVYPNPFMNVLVIDSDIDEARMYDATGRSIKTLRKGNNDVSQLSRGLYTLRLVVDGDTVVRRMIKLE